MRRYWAVELPDGTILQNTLDSNKREVWYWAYDEPAARKIHKEMKRDGVKRWSDSFQRYAKRAGWKLVEAKVVKEEAR